MKIEQALEDVQLLYVDSAPLIYFIESYEPFSGKIRRIFQAVDQNKLQISSSVITLVEVLNKPIFHNDTLMIGTWRDFFFQTSGIHLLPVDAEISLRAASLRAAYN